VISNLICNSLKFISKESGEEGFISSSIEKRKNVVMSIPTWLLSASKIMEKE
jgi:hypothetical protein